MAKQTFKTVNVVISGDGTMTTDIIGGNGKDCEGILDDLINAMGTEKKRTKKPEYYKDNKVQIHQRF